MSSPNTPNFEALEHRTFSFFPPILNVEHNEWKYRKATWSEICVVNTKSDVEVWIPRRLVSGISSIDEPVMIVGLNREMEYKAGRVWPYEKRVFEMPRAGFDPATAPHQPESVPASGIPRPRPASRTAESAESRVGRLIAIVLGVVMFACLAVYGIAKLAALHPVRFAAVDQDVLSLTRYDDYYSVVRKLGNPAEDRWRSENGELQYRLLSYPQRSCYLIIVGPDRKDAHYIGALDRNWKVLHWVDLPGRGDTASMLRSLPKF